MQIAKPFDKGLNGEMGAAEVAVSVELEQPSGKNEGWRKQGACEKKNGLVGRNCCS